MIDRVAERFKVSECKPTYLPADANSRLVKSTEQSKDKTQKMPYRENAVGEVSKFCENFSEEHWNAALKILKYLKTTKDKSLVFDGNNEVLNFTTTQSNALQRILARRVQTRDFNTTEEILQ